VPQKQKLERFPDWLERLSLYLEVRRDERFEWGEHDCGLFAAGAVKAITGVDVSEPVGAYADKLGAAEYLREKGYRTLKGAVTKKLGKPVHPSHCQKGDIILRHKAVGVCVGRFTWFVGEEPTAILVEEDGEHSFIYRYGLVAVPTLECHAGWKVGHVDG
jgi:hypothetical protein